jgi:signal transduction histidine kinase
MASAPSKPRAILGRLDAAGRLIAADAELDELQCQAGSGLGQLLALPQVAAVAELARKLGTTVSRPAVAASAESDIDVWVNATPEGDEIALSLEGWTARPPRRPRLAALLGGGDEASEPQSEDSWAADEELRLISVSPHLAETVGISATDVVGAPLTRLFRLEEDADGNRPLIEALASRRGFEGQRARARGNEATALLLSADIVSRPDGSFAGFKGTATLGGDPQPEEARSGLRFDGPLDDLLRSPLDRIIDTAEHLVTRADGPLRDEYANYGNDIASAARHLMSVLKGMGEDAAHDHAAVDLAALAAEAVVLLDTTAEEAGLEIEFDIREPLRVVGEERAIIQILVNLIANAIRHSPDGGKIRLSFSRTEFTASVCVIDEGPGIAAADRQRIFERFERAEGSPAGTGLGLAISRRLARAMNGDVTLDSNPGEGARFTLTLPAAA